MGNSKRSTYNFEKETAKASTIPSDWYFSNEAHQHDLDFLFKASWSLVGHVSDLKNPGDYITAVVANENIVVVRQNDTRIRGFSNVCRHRAGPVAIGSGNASVLKCQYHGWSYSLTGELMATPEFQGVENFERQNCKLPEVQVTQWGPFVFASTNPKMQFEEFIGTVSENLAAYNIERMVAFEKKDYVVGCNWKVYVDNYLEGYHLLSVHKELFNELDYSKYETILSAWYSLQKAPAREKASFYKATENFGEDSGQIPGEAVYYWLFPNLMLNIYQGLLQTNVVIPTGPKSCVVRFEWFTLPENLYKSQIQIQELIGFSDIIQEEDRGICEAVQKNLESSTYLQGRYSPKRETGVHHFHGLLSKFD